MIDTEPLHTLWGKAKSQPNYAKHEWMALQNKLETALARNVELEKKLAEYEWPDDADRAIPEDEAIKKVHPARTGESHEIYAEACRMVSAKQSKFALIELVNWLLHRVAKEDRPHPLKSGRPVDKR